MGGRLGAGRQAAAAIIPETFAKSARELGGRLGGLGLLGGRLGGLGGLGGLDGRLGGSVKKNCIRLEASLIA